MSAKIFSHFPPLPSRLLLSPPFVPPSIRPPCGFIWSVNSRGTIYTPDRFRSYHLLSILRPSSIPFFLPFSLFLSLSFSFLLFELGASRDTSLLPFLLSRTVSSYLRLSFLPLFRRHVLRAECIAKDAHSPRSSEPRLESGEILIAPIGVRTYFPRRQRRVEAEAPRETR